LVVEPMGEELLVFEPATDRAHSLNAPAASVWQECDGTRDVDALAQCCGLDPVAVTVALDSLRSCGLLLDFQGPRVSRRQALRKVAVLGAGIAAVPVIRSITAPSAAMAASTACIPRQGTCTGQSCCASRNGPIYCSSRGRCSLPHSHYAPGECNESRCKLGYICIAASSGSSSSFRVCRPSGT
jgi:hypothetical protein